MGIHLAYQTYHLAQHSSIQNRLRAELHSNTTTNSLRSLDSLPLLEAIVLETHRLTPSISGPLPRVTPPRGCELAGFFIPGGVRVNGQAYSLHKEEQLFGGDAGAWRPDRWLEAGEKKGKEMRRWMWMWQFGGGGRGCLGQQSRYFAYVPVPLLRVVHSTPGDTLLRTCIADGKFDAVAETKAVCVCDSYIGGPCPCSYPFPLKGVAQGATVFTHSALRPCPASVPHLKPKR